MTDEQIRAGMAAGCHACMEMSATGRQDANGLSHDCDVTGDERDRGYIAGRRALALSVMNHCAKELGYNDHASKAAALVSQLEQTRAVLRNLCEHYGDPSFDDDLHLADVAEKYLGRQLDQAARRRGEPSR